MRFPEFDEGVDSQDFSEEPSSDGHLRIDCTDSNVRLIYFVPSNDHDRAKALGYNLQNKSERLIAKIDKNERIIVMYPFKTFEEYDDYLDSKYDLIEQIIVDWNGYDLPDEVDDVLGVFENIPQGLIRNYRYGFGFQRDYRFVIQSLEKMNVVRKLSILSGSPTGFVEKGSLFILNISDFQLIRKEINRITRHGQLVARSIKTFNVDEMLRGLMVGDKSTKSLCGSIEEIEGAIKSSLENRSKGFISLQQKKAVELVEKDTQQISKKNLEALIKLHQNIELVTLERLIEKFKQMIEKSVGEAAWQKLFTNNPFILSLAFGFPVTMVQGQAFVGGGRVQGDGGKIADFLVKTKNTNNAAVFEIKTPQTELIRNKPFRGGVYGPSAALSDSVSQISDQIHKLVENIYSIKVNSKIYDLETCYVQGVLLIGITPDGLERRKSLDLFRGNLRSINILTFDELLEKLRQLHTFLTLEK